MFQATSTASSVAIVKGSGAPRLADTGEAGEDAAAGLRVSNGTSWNLTTTTTTRTSTTTVVSGGVGGNVSAVLEK